MNPAAATVIASAFFGIGGMATYLALAPDSTSAADSNSAIAADSAELVALRESVRSMQAKLDEIANAPKLAPASGRIDRTLSDADLQRAIAAYFDEHGIPAIGVDGEAVPAEAETMEDLVAMLADADELEAKAIWKRLVEEGRDDELLEYLQANADANPNDPDVQLELGNAYLARTELAGAGMEAGLYATKADAAFDAALEADPEHWEARFTKAAALSFWPPVLGKQPAAIQQFEILIGQQNGAAPQPHHAQTHLLLGTLYQQTGQPDKALATWQSGLELFPDHSDLAQQIALANGQ